MLLFTTIITHIDVFVSTYMDFYHYKIKLTIISTLNISKVILKDADAMTANMFIWASLFYSGRSLSRYKQEQDGATVEEVQETPHVITNKHTHHIYF